MAFEVDTGQAVAAFVELLELRVVDAEDAEALELLRQAVALERQPGGMLAPGGAPFRLGSLRLPLKAFVFARLNPGQAAAIPLAGVLGLIGLGFLVGRGTK